MAGRRAAKSQRGRASLLGVVLAAALTTAPVPVAAQGFSLGTASPVRTLDQERLFLESRFGRRVQREIDSALRALAAQNEALQAELIAEELDLAERRPGMAPDEFRRLAEEFDARVTRIRNEQEARARAIAQLRDRERQRFFEAALPVLAQVLRESGAVAIIDSRTVVLSSEQLDITDLAIFMLDQRLGEGESPALPGPDDPPPPPGADGPAAPEGGATAGSGDAPPEGAVGNGRDGPGGPVLLPMTPPESDEQAPSQP